MREGGSCCMGIKCCVGRPSCRESGSCESCGRSGAGSRAPKNSKWNEAAPLKSDEVVEAEGLIVGEGAWVTEAPIQRGVQISNTTHRSREVLLIAKQEVLELTCESVKNSAPTLSAGGEAIA